MSQKALADLVPFVTVRSADKAGTLAEHTVNLVVLGDDSRLSLEEARNLLSPGGQLITRDGQTWKSGRNPADERHGDWTHYAADPHGTGIVEDTAVAPSNRLRWWDQTFRGAQLRTAQGVVTVVQNGWNPPGQRGDINRRASMMAVDAYSGVPLWKGDEKEVFGKIEDMRLTFVSCDAGVITIPHGYLQPAVLYNHYTGKRLVSYDQGLRFMFPTGKYDALLKDNKAEVIQERTYQLGEGSAKSVGTRATLVAHKDRLIQAYGRRVACLDIHSGKLLWQVDTKDPVSRANIDLGGEKVFLQESPSVRKGFLRWGDNNTSAITALSMDSGKQLWRNTDLKDKNLSQFLVIVDSR